MKSFSPRHARGENTLTQPPGAAFTSDRRHWWKQPKRRQRRMKRGCFEEAARLADTKYPGIVMPRRCWGIYCAAVSSFAALRMRCAPCRQRGGTCPLFNLKTAPDRFRSGALITRYHPASAANRGPWGPLTGPAVPPYCGFRRKTPGPVYRRLPHRLTPAAGSLEAGRLGFLPFKVANASIL